MWVRKNEFLRKRRQEGVDQQRKLFSKLPRIPRTVCSIGREMKPTFTVLSLRVLRLYKQQRPIIERKIHSRLLEPPTTSWRWWQCEQEGNL